MKTLLPFRIGTGFFYSLLIASFLSSPLQAQFQNLGSYDTLSGLPNYLTAMDTVDAEFVQRVFISLPEAYSVPAYNPQYLADSIDFDVLLAENADVWITYIAEGAGYRNALGFYTYDAANPPSSVPHDTAITIVFPNVSNQGSGGGLLPGHKVHLGTFPAGTKIGWVLIQDGFKNGAVSPTQLRLYSNPDFNPEALAEHRRHLILLRDTLTDRVVLGIEDKVRPTPSDNDFNDAVFYITANPNEAIVFQNINDLYQIGDEEEEVGTGNDGGLESHGALADKIALRQLRRQQHARTDYGDPAQLRRFTALDAQAGHIGAATWYRNGQSALPSFIPEAPLLESTEAYVSTPEDLLEISNASEVMAVDYFIEGQRAAALLASATENGAYDHTKAICDRLDGAEILDIQPISLDGFPLLLLSLRQASGALEYAISFAARETDANSASIEAHWTVEQFPAADAYYNFQIWAATPHHAKKIALEVLALLRQTYTLQTSATPAQAPRVFVRSGTYANGQLQLRILNRAGAESLALIGTLASSETAARQNFTQNISLSGAREENISISIGHVFDVGLQLANPADAQVDAIYMADGPWGADAKPNQAQLARFEARPHQAFAPEAGAYALERGALLEGRVKDEIVLFRMLRPAAEAIDLSTYNHVAFEAAGDGRVEVLIAKKGIAEWAEQYRCTIDLGAEAQRYELPFSRFVGGSKGDSFSAEDVFAIAFIAKGDGQSWRTLRMEMGAVQFFHKTEVPPSQAELAAFWLSPNPVQQDAIIEFELDSEKQVSLEIYNSLGQLIWREVQTRPAGHHWVRWDASQAAPGTYVCLLREAGYLRRLPFVVQH